MDDDKAQNKLDWVTSGERRAVGTAYTRFVRAMRFILPMAAIALTAVIVLWDDIGDRMSKVEREKFLPEVEQARNELLNPQFDSTDSEGRAYTITAARAHQDASNPKIMLLESPDAVLHMDREETMAGTARQGIYEQEIGKLFLNGAVQIDHSSGYRLQSDELRIDLKTSEAFSDLPVRVTGEMGTIDASGLEAHNETGLVVFKGPATLVLVNADRKLAIGRTP